MTKPIQMVDLFGQYLNIKKEIDEAIQEVIHSSVFIKGGKVNDFEKILTEYLNTNVIACGNGTDALQLIFMALGFQPGDEVITTPFTFVSSAEVLAFLKLKPIFVDVEADSFNIDPLKIENAITSKTKAILPVHLFGQNANMEAIQGIAKNHQLLVIEDAAQSIGSDFIFPDGRKQKSGTLGTAGITSFFPSKTLGAYGDGGAVFCNDPKLAAKIRSLANHGREGVYSYKYVGINSRLDSMQAAILEVKLKYLDKFIQKRQEAADLYDKKLSGTSEITIPKRSNYSTHTFHQYTIKTENRDELKDYLNKSGIPAMIYYPTPLHLQKAYKYLGLKTGDCPVAETLSQTVLSLPMHTELDKKQMEFIIGSIVNFFE